MIPLLFDIVKKGDSHVKILKFDIIFGKVVVECNAVWINLKTFLVQFDCLRVVFSPFIKRLACRQYLKNDKVFRMSKQKFEGSLATDLARDEEEVFELLDLWSERA